MMKKTDKHFRFLCRNLSKKSYLYTEMIHCNAILKGDSHKLLSYGECEHPIALQLGGSNPKDLGEAAKIASEFNYDEIHDVLDLNIGKCRLSVSEIKDDNKNSIEKKNQSHLLVATKYKNTVTNYFAEKGIRAECIKLNGAIELAPKLGICSTVVDLVSTGKTLKENNLVESEIIYKITSKLVINRIAYKLMNEKISELVQKFSKVING